MRLWRSTRGGLARPEGTSDKEWLETLLDQLADEIAADGDDKAHLGWSRKVRAASDLIRRGNPWGLDMFLGLFDPVGRPFDQPYPVPNPFTEQAFARTSNFDEAHRLAVKLRQEHWREQGV